MKKITNNTEDIPKFRLVKKFLLDKYKIYHASFTIENIYELENGEFIVNCTINSYPKSPDRIVYRLIKMSEKELYSTRVYNNAIFIPLTDDLGQLSFISRRTTDDRRNILYSLDDKEKFHFTNLEPFKDSKKYQGKVAQVTIKISSIQSLLFLINEKGEMVSPILDTKRAYLHNNPEEAYIELPDGMSIDNYVSDLLAAEEADLGAVNEAIEGLEERGYELKNKAEDVN